jgi:pyrroloquinoline quinone biosynthesis protein D
MSAPAAAERIPKFARGVRLHHDKSRDAWVLLAPERVLQPDPVALEILRRVDGKASFAAIVDDLAASFSAPRERIEPDVETFLGGLAEKGFVEFLP